MLFKYTNNSPKIPLEYCYPAVPGRSPNIVKKLSYLQNIHLQ